MKTAVIGYPRVGTLRELKFATEKYFSGVISKAELQDTAARLRKTHWQTQAGGMGGYFPFPAHDGRLYSIRAIAYQEIYERNAYRSVTILNLSFPREDISLKECAFQIALAIRAEVLDLEAFGIKIIQIDEAALREKLPLRKSDWHSEYLNWAIPAFRLVHSGVKPQTQIHTHMCYSEFSDIIRDIDDMDADVITFEASRSDLTIINALNECGFKTEVGPGVYDIHSPRIPSVAEIKAAIFKMLEKTPIEKLWLNPDCGLKTRRNVETVPSLENLVTAAREVREGLQL